MKIFPGVQAHMGRWTYYIVKMSMRDLASNVMFAQEGTSLEETLQRTLKESRAKTEIVAYLQKQPDRFFNSIVIAAEGGDPKWFPVSMANDPALALLQDAPLLKDSFGVLRFDGNERYYALDGQHRLKAIGELTKAESPSYVNRPVGFENEEISVVLVVPGMSPGFEENPVEFRRRFRRLFGHLNRYAKPMDMATTIIMDEDDSFAIVTRRLFEDHEFFKAVGPHKDSIVVETRAGKNMRANQVHFTNLETLYDVNERLLTSSYRKNNGWDDNNRKTDEFKRFRPADDETLDLLYGELSKYWTAILETFPVLRNEPFKMRNHAVVGKNKEDIGDDRDHLLFWPLGQLLLADLVRNFFDQDGISETSTLDECKASLAPLRNVTWDLGQAPWRNLLLVPKNDKWVMRGDSGRVPSVNLGINILSTLFHPHFGADEETLDSLKQNCAEYLVFGASETDNVAALDNWWEESISNLQS
jgi:DNA sulfur modification protein DndB